MPGPILGTESSRFLVGKRKMWAETGEGGFQELTLKEGWDRFGERGGLEAP